MLFKRKNKSGNKAINLSFVDGVESYSKGTAIELSLDDKEECLVMKARVFKDKPIVKLNYEQIVAAEVITEREIIESGKSTVGRALVGGVLLGSLGAIVGGMSGIGNKTKSSKHYFLVVNYKSSNSEEAKALSFEIVGASLHWDSFVKELKTKIKVENTIEKEIYL